MRLAIALMMSGLISTLQGLEGPGRVKAISAVSDTTDAAVRELLSMANWRGRDAVVTSLERADPPRVALMLEVAKTHPKLATRRSAIRSLGRVGPEGVCDTLRAMFGRGSDSVILDVMTDRQDCSAAFVSPFLWDSDPDVRRRAFAASAKMDRNVAIGVAGKALGDSHHGVRSVVSSFLVGEGNAALPVLELALKDTSSVRRLAALRVLGQFDEGRSLLEGAVRSADWQNRFIATEGLAEIGDESSIAILTIRVEVETHPRVVEALTHALVRGGKDQDE